MSRYSQDQQGNLTLIAGNSDYDVIAPKETSPATAPHATGSQILYGNALYNVIDDIAIGDTLTVGTNISASDDITTQISNKISIAPEIITNTADFFSSLNVVPDSFSVEKVGKIIYLSMGYNGSLSLIANTWNSLAAIKTEFFPRHHIDFFAIDNNISAHLQARISFENGKVLIWSNTAVTNQNIRIYVSYVCK